MGISRSENQDVGYQYIRKSGRDKFTLITWYPDSHYLVT